MPDTLPSSQLCSWAEHSTVHRLLVLPSQSSERAEAPLGDLASPLPRGQHQLPFLLSKLIKASNKKDLSF